MIKLDAAVLAAACETGYSSLLPLLKRRKWVMAAAFMLARRLSPCVVILGRSLAVEPAAGARALRLHRGLPLQCALGSAREGAQGRNHPAQCMPLRVLKSTGRNERKD